MGFFDLLGIGKKSKRVAEFMDRGAVIVDVRSQVEFANGHVKDSINVPLDKIKQKLPKLKKLNRPLVLCCASGMRSGSATSILRAEGIDCMNGGGWRSLT